MKRHTLKTIWLAAMLVALALAAAPGALATTYPIPAVQIPNQPGAEPVEQFIGAPAVAHAVSAPAVPQNPFLFPGPWSNLHNDSYQSDTYPGAGPLGQSPTTLSTWLGTATDPMALVVGMTFDTAGNIVAAAIVSNVASGTATVQLTLLDPESLATLAKFDLPSEVFHPGFRPAGTYFYEDQLDRTIVGTVERTIWVVSHRQTADGWTFSRDETWDLTSAIPQGDAIEALAPDFAGHIWVTSKNGVVCTVDAETGALLGINNDLAMLGETIANGHAVSSDNGAFIASQKAMYRFDPDQFGRPCMTWRERYTQGFSVKPGQVELGTGTTPTLMGTRYVTITDNASPRMHVLVYLRAKHVKGKRLTCSVPVFRAGASCTENSLVCTDKSIIVENNYGYRSANQDTTQGRTTTPGITRIDLNKKGKGHVVWTNNAVSIPSLITKMSLANGLIYTYTKPAGPGTTDPWYFTALDFRTGKTVWKQLSGTGQLYDNFYAGCYIGPDGTLYVGVVGGISAMRDGQ
jgi:hypothetical protein